MSAFGAGDIVHVDGDRDVNWKVLGVGAGVAHLSKLSADPRIDWREVGAERLSLAGVPESKGSGS